MIKKWYYSLTQIKFYMTYFSFSFNKISRADLFRNRHPHQPILDWTWSASWRQGPIPPDYRQAGNSLKGRNHCRVTASRLNLLLNSRWLMKYDLFHCTKRFLSSRLYRLISLSSIRELIFKTLIRYVCMPQSYIFRAFEDIWFRSEWLLYRKVYVQKLQCSSKHEATPKRHC